VDDQADSVLVGGQVGFDAGGSGVANDIGETLFIEKIELKTLKQD
jgi:hypothetical protein